MLNKLETGLQEARKYRANVDATLSHVCMKGAGNWPSRHFAGLQTGLLRVGIKFPSSLGLWNPKSGVDALRVCRHGASKRPYGGASCCVCTRLRVHLKALEWEPLNVCRTAHFYATLNGTLVDTNAWGKEHGASLVCVCVCVHDALLAGMCMRARNKGLSLARKPLGRPP